MSLSWSFSADKLSSQGESSYDNPLGISASSSDTEDEKMHKPVNISEPGPPERILKAYSQIFFL